VVEITSERYELQTNRASFTGPVRVTERIADQELASLTCGTLLATLGASNQMQSLVAERDVVIAETSRRLTGARAAYDRGRGVLELSGNPTWQDGGYSGRGDVLLANLTRTVLTVRGNASVVLPRTQTGSLLGALAAKPGTTNALAARTNVPSAPQLTRVFCDEYEFSPELLTFRGKVRVDDAQMQLTSGALDVRLSPSGTNVLSLVADRNVVMNLLEASNQVTRATCARVVYTGTNDVLELSGQPAVQRCTPEATNTFTAEAILLNRKTGSISALGSSRGSVQMPLDGKTNAVALPFDPKK
jgi:lipopolysaccharide export system protein LptA